MSARRVIKGVGVSVVDYSLNGFERNLMLLEKLGCDTAEIMISECRVIAGGRLHGAQLRRCAKILGRRKLILTVHAPLIMNFMDERHADLHKRVCSACLAFCNAIGAKVLVVHPGWTEPQHMASSLDRLLDLELHTLLEMAAVAETHGVKIAVENLPPVRGLLTGQRATYGLEPARLAALLAAAAHPNLCGTLDLSHAYIAANYRGVELLEFIKPFLPHVNHLHFHDSFGRAPDLADATQAELLAYGIGDLHLPLGWGDMDWEGLVPQLAIRKGSIITMEITESHANEKEIAKSVRKARELARLFEQSGRSNAQVEAA